MDPVMSAHISEIAASDTPEADETEWKPIRRHFGIESFGTNAYVARREGDEIVGAHTEVADSGARHEELYFVASGHAVFTVDGETVDAPAGTFVFVRDPEVSRAAVARAAGTTVLCVGGEPGAAFEVSPWERSAGGE